jgi:predicted nucleic acid-binding protein
VDRLAEHRLMIVDACVVIDFIQADRSVLRLIAEHVGPVHVIEPIVEEISHIENSEELIELGLTIIEELELEDAYAAVAPGPISFQDRLCLLTAKRYGFTCVTNDKNLRKLCEQEKVPLLWGLELLIELHKVGGISGKEAIQVAQAIRESNSKHITSHIVTDFTGRIRRQESERSKP